MCDDRERLIGYVYDECDSGERRQIEAHLDGCPDCRREIGDLRHVRQDLLAWHVPDHEPIWRPVVDTPPTSSWQQIPAWAMTAAAGLLLMLGATGGVATRAWLFPAPAVVASVPSTARPSADALTRADIGALEARILATVRAEVEERVRLIASHDNGASRMASAPASTDALESRIASLEDAQVMLSRAVLRDVQRISEKQRTSDDRYLMLTSLSGFAPSGSGR